MQLQGDVVPLLALSVQQDPAPSHGLELQRDHVFQDFHFLLLEAVRDDALAVEADCVSPWTHRAHGATSATTTHPVS